MSYAQIPVISTTVDAKKKIHPNISNLGSEHQTKLLVCRLLRIRLLQSGNCLKAPSERFNTDIINFILFIRNQ